jgi:hypothetical protein
MVGLNPENYICFITVPVHILLLEDGLLFSRIKHMFVSYSSKKTLFTYCTISHCSTSFSEISSRYF